MTPLPKSGNLSITSNYLRIALSPIASKIANSLILNKIRPFPNPYFRLNQNGVRPGKSITLHILALRRIIEGVKEFQSSAIFRRFQKGVQEYKSRSNI